MKKRILQIRMTAKAVMISLLLGVVGMMNAFAQNFTMDDLNYSINGDGVSVTVTGHVNGTEATGTLIIPETVTYEGTNYFVTTIGYAAFSGCSGLTSVIMPNTVTDMGADAFSVCDYLASVTLSTNLTSIPSSAFSACANLSSITLPNSITSIAEFAFGGTGLYSVVIPNSVISIGGAAFHGSNLHSVIFGNSIETIAGDAFDMCDALTKVISLSEIPPTLEWPGFISVDPYITLPPKTLYVPANSVNAYQNASVWNELEDIKPMFVLDNLVYSYDEMDFTSSVIGSSSELSEQVNIPPTVTNEGFDYVVAFIGEVALSNTGITSVVIPNTVVSIGYQAFGGCNSLNSVIIPNSVVTIGEGAFYNCKSLTSLIIPNSVTTIGRCAFYNCSGFESLVIPSTVTLINAWAFYGCSNLTEVIMLGTIPPTFQNDHSIIGAPIFFDLQNNHPIYVPYESLEAYKSAVGIRYRNRVFPMSYKFITGYGEGNGNWQFIASPLAEITAPTEIDDMISAEGTYDLYRFDQSEEAEWRNYKANNFTLTNGQGYLYANVEDVNLIFKGEFNEGETKEVGLAYDANATFAGWNLVGNPFPVSAYASRSYYVMNEEGTAIEPVAVSMGTAIPACTGVMVKADAAGETVTFSKTAPEMAVNQGVLQIALSQVVEPVETPVYRGDVPSTSSGTLTLDKAIVSFNAGDHLEKFVFNKDNATLSIPQGGKDLAIACAERVGEMPLNFKASSNGQYTLSVNPENMEMDYLHLVDNMTGADIDLLATPSYTFNANTTDYASRFRLVFSASGDADGDYEVFAYSRDGEIIITADVCNASLQVVDVTGRVVVSVDGRMRHVSTAGMPAGVYVLRLIDGNDVRTQKIVIP